MSTTTPTKRPETRSKAAPSLIPNPSYFEIPVRLIDPDPKQPRLELCPDAIHALAQSLIEHGQIQPIVVRPSDKPGRYVIVAGERRWLAALQIGLPFLTAHVMETPQGQLDETTLRILQLVENLAREELNPIDQAHAFQALMTRNGWSGRQLADKLRVNQSVVARALNLLTLPAEIQDDIAAGRLAPRAALDAHRRPRPSQPAPDSSPNEASRDLPRRRVFATPFGRITIEPIQPGGFVEIAGAIESAANALCAERKAELAGTTRSRVMPADSPRERG